MKRNYILLLILLLLGIKNHFGQSIADFTSITPVAQSDQFIIPTTHAFQKIIEVGDILSDGITTLPVNPDFTGFVPISGSSTNGYLSINSEAGPGGNTILDINFNSISKTWVVSASEAVDFSSVAGTFANCSGTVTPWGTVISSEEYPVIIDTNNDDYDDFGWNIEIDPVTKTVVNNEKLWAMGNFSHENVAIHTNERTVYQGADVVISGKFGYLYKFVASAAQDLSDGLLYVYKGSKNGAGNWILIKNTSKTERNETYIRSGTDPDINDSDIDFADATTFNGIEDVEIGPDGMIYFAVKGSPDRRVYRFQDSDPISGTTVVNMETFVGNTDENQNITYNINNGTNTNATAWGSGNDNLAFDGDGNLWVLQDGDDHLIWVVKSDHTQAVPNVEVFGSTPIGSEPTGITFTPDYKYLFMSIQHPSTSNSSTIQTDAAGEDVSFAQGTVLAIGLTDNLGDSTLSINKPLVNYSFEIYPNPVKKSNTLTVKGQNINNIKLFSIVGKKVLDNNYEKLNTVKLNIDHIKTGLYFMKVNNRIASKLLID